MRSAKYWILVVFLSLPAFGLMLRPGIFSMHDPHLFRIQQFDLCARSFIFPCRWSPDSSMGYGSPLFNFYAQAPYLLTRVFVSAGASIVDSAKIAYIFSLVASALAMFIFARRHWGNIGGLISAVFYVFAPYRAVDVWVRGALPEALAFILYPLILYFLDRYMQNRRLYYLTWFSSLLALLILTHNLSLLMFLPFLLAYWIFQCLRLRSFSSLPGVFLAGIFSVFLSAFYLLPVIFENHLVTLTDTVSDYYNFQIHFTTLKELFISRFWGYGASLWAKKYLSVSAGQMHWLIPVILSLVLLVKRRSSKFSGLFLFAAGLGFFALFLTHGKSLFIWQVFAPMRYIQFPWRFLSVAAFFLSFSAGFAAVLSKKIKYSGLLIVSVILLNVGFFRPDVWKNITDADQFSGRLWDEGRSSSLTDFWPDYGPPPIGFAPEQVTFAVGEGETLSIFKSPDTSRYQVRVISPMARVVLPQVYFPGWTVSGDNQLLPFEYNRFGGLISVPLQTGIHVLTLNFSDTPVRRLGNYLSLTSTLVLLSGLAYMVLNRKYEI